MFLSFHYDLVHLLLSACDEPKAEGHILELLLVFCLLFLNVLATFNAHLDHFIFTAFSKDNAALISEHYAFVSSHGIFAFFLIGRHLISIVFSTGLVCRGGHPA